MTRFLEEHDPLPVLVVLALAIAALVAFVLFPAGGKANADPAVISQFWGATRTVVATRPPRVTTVTTETTCPAGMFALAAGHNWTGAGPIEVRASHAGQLPFGEQGGSWVLVVRVLGGGEFTPFATCAQGVQDPGGA